MLTNTGDRLKCPACKSPIESSPPDFGDEAERECACGAVIVIRREITVTYSVELAKEDSSDG